MKYEVILESGNHALILRGNNLDEYAVVNGLNEKEECWAYTVSYYNFGKYTSMTQAEALSLALDCFRKETEENYTTRKELEELIGLFECGNDEPEEEYYDDYISSSTEGDYSPSNPWDAPGMSIHDFI